MVKRKVVWDELARAALRAVYNHIKEDSPKQAEKVKQEIIAVAKRLAAHPEMHPQDKYRKDKDVRFRSFEKHNYRVSYFIADDAIRVLRLRHVKQEPKEY
jgi:plasmid stabilization system protein ParE